MYYDYILNSPEYFNSLIYGKVIIPESILNSLSSLIHEYLNNQ